MCNLKNVKNTNGWVLLLARLQGKVCNFTNTPQWVFFTFFKLHKLYQIVQSIACFRDQGKVHYTLVKRQISCWITFFLPEIRQHVWNATEKFVWLLKHAGCCIQVKKKDRIHFPNDIIMRAWVTLNSLCMLCPYQNTSSIEFRCSGDLLNAAWTFCIYSPLWHFHWYQVEGETICVTL